MDKSPLSGVPFANILFQPVACFLILWLLSSTEQFLNYLFITYLVALGLSCSMWDLPSFLWHVESLVSAGKCLVTACGI